jgi:hypothetical protein
VGEKAAGGGKKLREEIRTDLSPLHSQRSKQVQLKSLPVVAKREEAHHPWQ